MSPKPTSAREPAIVAALRRGDDGPLDDVAERIIAAAHLLICRHGVQRTTMDEVAREAGITRITVYRRFATKDDLVVHVVRAELRRYFQQFRADIAVGTTAEERVVLGFVSSVRTMRSNPLIDGLSRDDNGAERYAVMSDGALHDAVSAFVQDQLRAEQAAGAVAEGVDVDLAADIMVRLCTSFLLTPGRVVDVNDDAEMRRVAERVLVPLLRGFDMPSPSGSGYSTTD